jgi:hypothetical protein
VNFNRLKHLQKGRFASFNENLPVATTFRRRASTCISNTMLILFTFYHNQRSRLIPKNRHRSHARGRNVAQSPQPRTAKATPAAAALTQTEESS